MIYATFVNELSTHFAGISRVFTRYNKGVSREKEEDGKSIIGLTVKMVIVDYDDSDTSLHLHVIQYAEENTTLTKEYVVNELGVSEYFTQCPNHTEALRISGLDEKYLRPLRSIIEILEQHGIMASDLLYGGSHETNTKAVVIFVQLPDMIVGLKITE